MNVLFLIIFLTSLVSFAVGLIRPGVFNHLLKSKTTRGDIVKIFGSIIFTSFILFSVTVPNNQPQTQQEQKQSISKEERPKTTNDEYSAKMERTETNPTLADANKSPAPTKTEDKPAPVPSETVSQKNAVRSAKAYLDYSAFSHDGLVTQLEYEQFSHADAVYGVNNSDADWNEQAAKSAKAYLEYSAFSRGGLITQLKYEKFTQSQAEYGANAVGL